VSIVLFSADFKLRIYQKLLVQLGELTVLSDSLTDFREGPRGRVDRERRVQGGAGKGTEGDYGMGRREDNGMEEASLQFTPTNLKSWIRRCS